MLWKKRELKNDMYGCDSGRFLYKTEFYSSAWKWISYVFDLFSFWQSY